MKIFEYEKMHMEDQSKIKIESIEEKVRFLIQVLHRLKNMYLEGVTDIMSQDKSKSREYPNVPPEEFNGP